MPDLAVAHTVRTHSLVIALTGDLDILTAPACAASLEDATRRDPGRRSILLDMRNVDFCGSEGLRVLAEFARKSAERGAYVGIVADERSVVRRILDLTGLGVLLPVFEEIPAAEATLGAIM